MDVAADSTSKSSFAAAPTPDFGANVSAAANPQAADLRSKILERIVAQTQAAQLPKEWDFLGVTKSMRRLACEPSDLVASLRAEFSLDELLDTRIVEAGPDNQPRLSPVFGDTSSSFVILVDGRRLPSDVISARGVLSSPAPVWLRLAAVRADGATRYDQPILLAFSDAEALVLHRLGCPFSSAAGLEQLSGEQVRAIFGGRPKRREQRRYTLTLACWQIAECMSQPSPSTLSTLARIARIKTVFGCDPAAVFAAWLPTPAEIRALRDARSFSDRAVVVEMFSHSLHRSRFSPAAALQLMRDRAAIDYGTARHNLVREIELSRLAPRCGQVAAALARFERAFQADFLAKFHASCTASSDPWEKLRLVMGEDIARSWWNTLDEVSAAQNIIAGEYPDQRDSAARRDLRLRLVGTFAKLYALRLSR